MLNVWRINRRGVDRADALDRSVEVIEGVFLDEHGHHRGNSAEGLGLIDEHHAVGFHHGFEDGVHVERADRAEVEDFGVDAVFGLEDFGGGEGSG